MFSAPFLVTLLDRVKAVVRRVARPAAKQTRNAPASAPDAAISSVSRALVQVWMRSKLRALSALMRRIEAGEMLPTLGRAPFAIAEAGAPKARSAVPPEERLPRGFGWLCSFGPNVRRDGRAFAEWLNEPAMKAKVLAQPERMARLIGPILSATGERRPDWFPVAPKRMKNLRRSCAASPCLAEPSMASGAVGDITGDRRAKPGDDDYLIVTTNLECLRAALKGRESGALARCAALPVLPPYQSTKYETQSFQKLRRMRACEDARLFRFD